MKFNETNQFHSHRNKKKKKKGVEQKAAPDLVPKNTGLKSKRSAKPLASIFHGGKRVRSLEKAPSAPASVDGLPPSLRPLRVPDLQHGRATELSALLVVRVFHNPGRY
jgi:hypothetical protein